MSSLFFGNRRNSASFFERVRGPSVLHTRKRKTSAACQTFPRAFKIFAMKSKTESNEAHFNKLVNIMARLRSEDGCPWDRIQSMDTLKAYVIDEAYEVVDAVESGDRDHLCEELGDLLFQIVFLAQLGKEEGAFDIGDVIRIIEEKMIRRHPHVFGDEQASDPDAVKNRWEQIKAAEGKKPRTSVLSNVPETLPALYRAFRLGVRAAKVGFDWKDVEGVMEKVREEFGEMESAVASGDMESASEELGDLLFSLAMLSRHLDREPEGLLRKANEKFIRRFGWVEESLKVNGSSPENSTLEEMDRLWDQAKTLEKGAPPERPLKR